MRPNTKVVYCESPGSLTFEVQDIPAIAAVAHRTAPRVLMDNTWATPYLFRSFEHGVDVSIHAAHQVHRRPFRRHARRRHHQRGKLAAGAHDDRADLGHCAGPDDMLLRAARHAHLERAAGAPPEERAGSRALAAEPGRRCRACSTRRCPRTRGHAIWKRDFLGASGLFGVVLQPASKEAVYAFIDALDLFGIGASWGGFESLIQPAYPERTRTATRWHAEGPLVRLHIGLEDPQDLIADLAQGLDQLRATAG